MKYLYYPGCSLEGTALEYNRSTCSLMAALGVELVEIDDWSCCGASAATTISELLSLVLPARNLALAERMCEETGEKLDILVPCSACYLNLKKVSEQAAANPALLDQLNSILAEDGLKLENHLNVRHLLDVLSKDLDPDHLAASVISPLFGVSAAPYYGCQCLRPYPVFDDPEKPESMDALIRACGATPYAWAMGGVCCGASHMNTKPEVGKTLVGRILSRAGNADVILTVCPMCQMNLEGYQKKTGHACHKEFNTTILYLPQFIGIALGLSEEQVRTDLNLSITADFKKKIENLTRTSLTQASSG